MTDTKRILPWQKETDDEKYQWLCGDVLRDGFRACTRWSDYIVYPRVSGKWTWAHMIADGEYWDANGVCENVNAALDACEADYLSRCTEFLRVAGPGECVVNAIDLEGLLAMYQKGTRYADSDEIVQRLTAAIDAARGSK